MLAVLFLWQTTSRKEGDKLEEKSKRSPISFFLNFKPYSLPSACLTGRSPTPSPSAPLLGIKPEVFM